MILRRMTPVLLLIEEHRRRIMARRQLWMLGAALKGWNEKEVAQDLTWGQQSYLQLRWEQTVGVSYWGRRSAVFFLSYVSCMA